MNAALYKFGPTGAVLIVVSLCVWPYLTRGRNDAAKTGGKSADDAPLVLSPEILSPPKRDPFQGVDAGPPKRRSSVAKGTAARKGTSPAEAAKSAAAKRAAGEEPPAKDAGAGSATAKRNDPTQRPTATTAASKADAGTGKQPGTAAAGTPPPLFLSATSLMPGNRLAVINDRIYREGETIADGSPLAAPCKVAEIQPYKVILQGAGREIALTYSDRERPAAKAAAGGAAKAVAGKGRKPPAAAAKSKPSRPAKPSPRGKEAP